MESNHHSRSQRSPTLTIPHVTNAANSASPAMITADSSPTCSHSYALPLQNTRRTTASVCVFAWPHRYSTDDSASARRPPADTGTLSTCRSHELDRADVLGPAGWQPCSLHTPCDRDLAGACRISCTVHCRSGRRAWCAVARRLSRLTLPIAVKRVGPVPTIGQPVTLGVAVLPTPDDVFTLGLSPVAANAARFDHSLERAKYRHIPSFSCRRELGRRHAVVLAQERNDLRNSRVFAVEETAALARVGIPCLAPSALARLGAEIPRVITVSFEAGHFDSCSDAHALMSARAFSLVAKKCGTRPVLAR